MHVVDACLHTKFLGQKVPISISGLQCQSDIRDQCAIIEAKPGVTRRSISDVGAAPPISPVPTSCAIRSPTAHVHGKRLATTSMRQSPLRSGSRHISKLWMPMSWSFRTKTKPVGRKSRTPCISGSRSFNFFRAKTNRARAKRHCERTTTRLGFFLDFTAQQNLRFLDQIDRNQLLRYVKFLREHESDLDDRTVHNIFETLNTFLRTR
jgi:hypothetical protein